MDNLICLADFRRRNGLSQAELGQLLGTSPSFISLVESGNSKFSREKMKRIEELSAEQGWFLDDLVPAFYRLGLLCGYIETSHDLSSETIKKFRKDFDRIVPKSLFESIKYGQQGIDSVLADKIITILPPGYIINKEWLMSGEGPMRPGETTSEDSNGEWEMTIDAKGILSYLEKIMKKQEALEAMLVEMKSILVNKS